VSPALHPINIQNKTKILKLGRIFSMGHLHNSSFVHTGIEGRVGCAHIFQLQSSLLGHGELARLNETLCFLNKIKLEKMQCKCYLLNRSNNFTPTYY
jgi:hypothetical protein